MIWINPPARIHANTLALVALALIWVWFAWGVSRDARAAGPSGACPPTSAAAPLTPTAPAGSTQPGPEAVLACVDAQPITGATYEHWLAIAEKLGGPSAKGRGPDPGALLNQVMSFLISSDWVLGEAAARHVSVSDTQVHRSFDRIRRLQFPKPVEFTKFLERSGQNVEDLLYRVKLNLLVERIQRKVEANRHGIKARKRALARFVRGFEAKWKPQTYCDPRYVVKDCGHVQSQS